MTMLSYQTPETPNIDRTDHVWIKVTEGFKCVLCGAITFKAPPNHTTPKTWTPNKYDKLSGEERTLCPYVSHHKDDPL